MSVGTLGRSSPLAQFLTFRLRRSCVNVTPFCAEGRGLNALGPNPSDRRGEGVCMAAPPVEQKISDVDRWGGT